MSGDGGVTPITEARSGRRKLPRAVREAQMLEVAEEAFAAGGFHSTSVDAIAEAAGITKPMVYAYFGSKEGLYLACMERGRRRLFEAVDAAAAEGASPDEQLWRGIVAFFTFVSDQRASWIVLFGEATPHGGPFAAEALRLRQQIARLVSQLLGEAATAEGVGPGRLGAIEPLAHALVGAAESLASWWLDHPEESRDWVSLRLMNLVWTGFGDLVRGESWTPPHVPAPGP